MHPNNPIADLRLACRLLRVALGLVWLLEGLLPKLLWPDPEQISLLASRLPIALPAEGMITALGIGQCVFGAWLLSGRTPRLTAGLSTVGVVAATAIITAMAPEAWVHFYGGAIKNLVFIAAGAALWLLQPAADQLSPQLVAAQRS